MKILIITPRYLPTFHGGGEISVGLLANNLSRMRHDVTVLSFDGNSVDHKNGVRIIRKPLHSKSSQYEKIKILNFIRVMLSDFDIIHAYNMFYYDYLGILSILTGRKIFATLNNLPDLNDSSDPNPLKRMKRALQNNIRLTLIRPLKLIAISDPLREEYLNRGFKNIRVIPNMVDERYFEKRQAKKHRYINVLFVGVLYPTKGVDILIRAVAICLPACPGLRLIIVGAGNEMQRLKQLASNLHIGKITMFKGMVDYTKLIDIYDSADIFVHPGLWKEPFGRTVIEAMARGLPAVVSDIGAPPMIVKRHELIFRSGDPAELAEKILALIKDKALRAELSKCMKDEARRYHPKKIMPEILSYYCQTKQNA